MDERGGKAVLRDGSVEGMVYLGLFDILGYRDRLLSSSLLEMVAGFGPTSPFQRGADYIAAMASLPHFSRFKPASCIRLSYADTILLCAPDPTERGLVAITTAAIGLMSGAVAYGIPLRGAIARGEFFLTADRQFYTGKVLARAHALEQNQDWVGAVFAKDCLPAEAKYLTTDSLLRLAMIAYAVPKKRGDYDIAPALNWCPFYAGTFGNDLEARLRPASPEINEDVERKIRNTLAFSEWSVSRWSTERGRLDPQPSPSVERWMRDSGLAQPALTSAR